MATYPNAPSPVGSFTALNISVATVVKPGPGVVMTIAVVTAGSTAGAVYDATSTTGNTVANQVGVLPAVAGTYAIEFPCINGIVVAPGTGQVVAVSYF